MQIFLVIVGIYLAISALFLIFTWIPDAWRYNRLSANKVNPRSWEGFKSYVLLSLVWFLIALGYIISGFQKNE